MADGWRDVTRNCHNGNFKTHRSNVVQSTVHINWRLWRVGSFAGGDALCATLFAGGLEMPQVTHCVLLCLLEVVEVMCYVLLCSPEAIEVLEVAEVMRRVLLCLLEVVEVADVMRRVAALYARGHGGCGG